MPFTLSHPAAAVPLARFGLPLSALVVGSMAPDFPYFLHWSTAKQYAHTLTGIFAFCLPAGLLVLAVFHLLLKYPLLSLLPESHQARLGGVAGPFPFGPFRRFLLILLALLVGALTHVAWDSCTHAAGWTVRHLPVLGMRIDYSSHGSFRVFKFLQFASTFVGAGLLVLWYVQWYKATPPGPSSMPMLLSVTVRFRLVACMAVVAAGVGLLYSCLASGSSARAGSLRTFAFHWIVATTAAVAVELLVYSIQWHISARQAKDRTTG